MPALIKCWLINIINFFNKPVYLHIYMLQQTLKEATKNKHTALEQLMFVQQIMEGTLSIGQYTQILSTNYLVHYQFENKLHNLVSADNAHTLELDKRQKTTLLKNDLLEINAVLPDCATDKFLIHVDNEAAALGALYVLEGATLGGNIIVKKLKTNLNLIDLNLHFYYYQAYGDLLTHFWKAFCEVLNNQPLHVYNQVIEGANNMFDYLITVQKKTFQTA